MRTKATSLDVIDNDLEARPCQIGYGWLWLVQAFAIFRRAVLLWTLTALSAVVLIMASSLIPGIGNFLTALLIPVLQGGMAMMARQTEQGQQIPPLALFQGFAQGRQLFRIGLYYLLSIFMSLILISIVAGICMQLGWVEVITPENMKQYDPRKLFPFLLLFLPFFAIIYSSTFFAPALVSLRQLTAGQAMRLSCLGFWRNWKPILLMGIINLILMFAGSLPMMLGLLIVLPIVFITSYTSYQTIYEQPKPTPSTEQ